MGAAVVARGVWPDERSENHGLVPGVLGAVVPNVVVSIHGHLCG